MDPKAITPSHPRQDPASAKFHPVECGGTMDHQDMGPMKRISVTPVLLTALGVLIAPGRAAAQEALGFAEARASLSAGVSGKPWQLVERVRPTLASELQERVKLVLTVEAGFAQGRDLTEELERTLRASDFGPLLEQAGCRWRERRNEFLRIDDADDYLDVDRLFVDVYAGALDLRLGRQALNWGSAQFFNPTDPFPEVLLAEPWRPRRGVNALRAHVPIGENRDVSAVVASNDAFDQLRAAGRARVNWAGTDFALVGAWRGDSRQALAGLDLRGTLGVGWWIEGAYLLGTRPHEELAVGIDYSWPILERATAFAQYYRNGAGQTDPSAATQRIAGAGGVRGPVCPTGPFPLGTPADRDPFAPFTLGRNYLLLGGALAVLPELAVNLALLQNLDDGSGMFVPTINYELLDWLAVAFSAQVPYALWGRGGELKPRPEDLSLTVDVPGAGPLSADFSGLVPSAVFTLWTRASF
jgi:hypothetical protein